MTFKSEIRDSVLRDLIEKVKKSNYKEYLLSIRLEKIRKFNGAQINFNFPVTALIGPNGGGKSTIIGAALLAYQSTKPSSVFKKSIIGDDGMKDWLVEFEAIDKTLNKTGTTRFNLQLANDHWKWNKFLNREVKFLSINRTVPISERAFSYKKRIASRTNQVKKKGELIKKFHLNKVDDIDNIKREAEKILGKSLYDFTLYEFQFQKPKNARTYKNTVVGAKKHEDGSETPIYKKEPIGGTDFPYYEKQYLYVGGDGTSTYSEFNFGSGETSIIRMVAELENLPNYSLVLIEEIENGLHPVAVQRVVEYFIDLASRKNIQVIFTTHSDYALKPLPSEAIWACMDGALQQGKLSIETLRALTGRIDKKLAIFVEDEFAKKWVEYIIRLKLGNQIEEIGVFPSGGDGNAVKTHEAHNVNPTVHHKSICILDGDSNQKENAERDIFRLPGLAPESTVFNSVLMNLDKNIALLTAACQLSLSKQEFVSNTIKELSKTNRNHHLLFSQLGQNLGFISEEITRGAFLFVWTQENEEEVNKILSCINKYTT